MAEATIMEFKGTSCGPSSLTLWPFILLAKAALTSGRSLQWKVACFYALHLMVKGLAQKAHSKGF